MIPDMINTLTRWWLHRRFRSYRTYPAATTMVVLVDVHKGLVSDSSRLVSSLTDLVAFARHIGFGVAHSGFDASAERKFETPAHRLLRQALGSLAPGDHIPDALVPRSEDLVIEPRPGLSIFHATDLHTRLKKRAIEHLIIAGPLATITVDSSVRDGVQLGYHVTLIPETLSEDIGEVSEYVRDTLGRYAQSILSFPKFKLLVERGTG